LHVPNKGMSPALLDLMGGPGPGDVRERAAILAEQSDRVRPIAMAEKRRSALMPDLPTMEEFRPARISKWRTGPGSLVLPGLDPRIVARLARRDRPHHRCGGHAGAHQDSRLRPDRQHAAFSLPINCLQDVERWREVVRQPTYDELTTRRCRADLKARKFVVRALTLGRRETNQD